MKTMTGQLAPAPPKMRTASNKPTLLLADSDEALLDVMRRGLALRGFEVETATGGVECLSKLRLGTAEVVVLNLELFWGGGDGVLAVMQNDPALARIPVVLTSARTVDVRRPTGDVAQIVCFLEKPFPLEVLLDGIDWRLPDRPRNSGDRSAGHTPRLRYTRDRSPKATIVRDATECKRNEMSPQEREFLRTKAELAHTRIQLARVMASAPNVIVALDGEGRVTSFNPAAERIFGCPAAAAIGCSIEQFLPAGVPENPARGTDGSVLFEVEGRRADGATVHFVTFPSGGEPARAGCSTLILGDITGRKRAEEELRARTAELEATTRQLWQAARLAGVGELAASIAHELNNPLGTVSLRIEGVLAKTPPDDPRRKALEVIEQEIERMAGLVGNLLQFSRAGVDKASTVDITEEITKALELVDYHLRKQQIWVAPEFASGVPAIFADRQHLRQVFLNLFTNAADAMPAGGCLSVRVHPGELPGRCPAVVVEVNDTGEGIPAHLLSRVTDPFFSTKEEGKGTGLGLAICKRIIEQHQGTLEIESQVCVGTTVRMTMPVHPNTNVTKLHASY